MKETIIVSLTTWYKRIGNIPVVLDSIYGQTMLPDKVVLNLAYDEEIPEKVKIYIEKHGIEVYYTEDTKVYKKFIPTLKRYPEACAINIDDDCIYPKTMIEDFMALHKQYPQFPISGNKVVLYGMQCHCGGASLTKAEYFGEWLEQIDAEVMQNCASSDIVFTFMATKNGHPYIHSKGEYFLNLIQPELENESYSSQIVKDEGLEKAYTYLVERFGKPESPIDRYVSDPVIAETINHIMQEEVARGVESQKERSEKKIRATKAYRVGKMLLCPLRWLKNF